MPTSSDLLADQQSRWARDERVRVEDLVAHLPELRDRPEELLDLIYGEVILRRQVGDRPVADEYVARFPRLAEPIRLQFEVDDALGDGVTNAGGSSVPIGPEVEARVGQRPAPPGYEILEVLGRGGMGVVYKARQIALDRLVALKMIRSGEFADPAERTRFEAEARAIARLSHPNVVQIYEVGEANGQPFLALEYVAGGSLADALRGPPFAPRPAAALIATLARAVQHAHAAGVVHRDLKPANVLIQRHEPRDPDVDTDLGLTASTLVSPATGAGASDLCPKLTDFGLAKHLGTDGPTQTGDFLGTPNYTAPEQAAGRADVGPPADVYALGAILYHLVAGRPPFAGSTPLETLDQVRFEEPVPPSRLRPNLPRDLSTIILTCLHKDPLRRYPTARALSEDSSRFLTGQSIRARAVSRIEKAAKWARRRPAVAGLLASVVMLTTAALIIVTGLWRRESAAKQAEHHQREVAENRSAALLLANARLHWLTGDFDKARQALGDVSTDFQNADWRYLKRACAPPLLDLTIPSETILRLAYSLDGKQLAGMTNAGRVCIWDSLTGKETVAISQRFTIPQDLKFAHDGRLIVATLHTLPASVGVAKGSMEVSFIHPETGAVLSNWSTDERARSFQIASGGKYAVFAGFESPIVLVLDGATGQVLHRLGGHSRAGVTATFNPTGTLLVTQGHNQDPRVWNPITGEEVRKLPLADGDRDLEAYALHPDGNRFVLRRSLPTRLSQFIIQSTLPNFEPMIIQSRFNSMSAASYSLDGRRLAGYGNSEHFVDLWDAETGSELLSLRGLNDQITSIRFSPDGRSLAVGCRMGRLSVWDVRPIGEN